MDTLTSMIFTSSRRNHPSTSVAGATFWGWLAAIAAFHSFVDIAIPPSAIGQIALLLLVPCLYLIWLSLIHTVVSALFRVTLCRRAKNAQDLGSLDGSGAVAILLCTRDDWELPVAQAALAILGKFDHLFVCDDSEHEESKRMIDQFELSAPTRCTIVRRGTLEGFKAGNLNHCVSLLNGEFPFIAILDHDTKLHPLSLECARRHFLRDASLAFVQFGLRHDSPAGSGFARELALTIDVASWLQSVRECSGVPICIGRAVVFRADLLKACGGFPTVISEDVAITLKLLRIEARGYHEPAYPAAETIPEDYVRFRARQARWSVGTLHAWVARETRLPVRRWFTADGVDILLQVMILWYPFLTSGFLIAGLMVDWSSVLSSRFMGALFLTGLMPFLPSIPLLAIAGGPSRALRTAIVHAAVFLSMITSVSCALVASLFFGAREFTNSGNRFARHSVSAVTSRHLFTANGLGTLALELAVVVVLAIAIARGAWILLPLQAGLAAGVIFRIQKWESLPSRLALMAPMVAYGAVWTRIAWMLPSL